MEKQEEQQELKDIIATREEGFGHLFKVARNEKNLSIEDVAQKLRLDTKIITALESEDHTQLPAAAFVCGYIRNYAKLLSLQPDSLVEYYRNERADEILESQLKVVREKKSFDRSVISKILLAAVVPAVTLLIVLALLAGGWQAWLYISEHYLSDNSNSTGSVSLLDDVEAIERSDVSDEGTLLLPEHDSAYEPSTEELVEAPAEVGGSLPAEG